MLIVERIEAHLRHLYGIEDVVSGLERLCHGAEFFSFQYCQKVCGGRSFPHNVF